MLSPTTARGLLGIFLRGTDPPATYQRATTLPIQSPTSSSLWSLLAAVAGERGARGKTSGRKSPRDGRGGSAGEGGGT